MIVLSLLTFAAALIVIARSVCIINLLHWTTSGHGYSHFLGFGLAHALLAMGALLELLDATDGDVFVPGALITIAVALVILFDKRKLRR